MFIGVVFVLVPIFDSVTFIRRFQYVLTLFANETKCTMQQHTMCKPEVERKKIIFYNQWQVFVSVNLTSLWWWGGVLLSLILFAWIDLVIAKVPVFYINAKSVSSKCNECSFIYWDFVTTTRYVLTCNTKRLNIFKRLSKLFVINSTVLSVSIFFKFNYKLFIHVHVNQFLC